MVFCPAYVGAGGRHIGEALVIALVVFVFDECGDLDYEITRQEVVTLNDRKGGAKQPPSVAIFKWS